MRDSGATNPGSPGTGRRRLAITASLAGLGLLAAACSAPAPMAHVTRAQSRVPAAQLTITPADGSSRANPSKGVTVSVAHGTLSTVTLTQGSHPVAGLLNAAHTAWHTRWPLLPARTYTVTATAVDARKLAVTRTQSFSTLTPSQTVQVQIFEGYHQTYGVGIPIMMTFSRPVHRRAAVERAMQLWTSRPVTGAWYWDSSTSLVFRPRDYWPQHTRVRFVAHMDGLEVARGVYGTANLAQSFRIGNSLIAVVSTAHHYAKIYYRGKLFGNWPVSTGAPGDDTADGTYLTIEKANPVLMSGPGYTNFPVPYSVRFTWSGDYMHDAYWSVGEQGYTNVSHGCVNLSPYHAQVYYGLAVPGDPVTITGSPAAGIWDDGWTEWFLSWKQLLRGSATHQAVQAGPAGSTFVSPASLPASTARAPLGTSRRHNSLAQ
jgi:lipoprotein-anchoring transpeptidase ErfK/SrfK